MTTYTLEREDTGEHIDAWQIRDEINSLDGAATEAPLQVGGWIPGPDNIPDHIHDDLCRRVQPGEYAGEPTPRAFGYIPDVDDLRERNRLTQASVRLLSVLDAKAQMWHEVASEAWACQGVRSRVSQHYTDRREALLSAYEAECERIKDGLARTSVEYGGHTYDDEHGFVPTGAPERHDPPQRDDEPEPDDRVQRMAEQRRRRDTLAARSSDDEPTSEVGSSGRTSKSRRGRVGGWIRRRGEWLAAAGVFVAWAAGIGITIWLTGGP